MHYAKHVSRSTSLEDSSPNAPDKQYKVKAGDVGFEVPEHILPDIIPLHDARLDYFNIHTQRDRRLRILIRRFTNQIQYGCKNANCTTPTCLSYRKRNSTAPLRKYTELSARTLACQLLEDFSRGGKEPLAELCSNEPVVPWYEDPAVAKRRRTSLDKTAHLQYGHGAFPKGQASVRWAREPSQQSPGAEQVRRKLGHDGIIQAGRGLRTMDTSKDSKEIAKEVVDLLNTSLASQGHHEERSEENPGSMSVGTVSPTAFQSLEPAKPKDLASFTQNIFDLLPLRLLSWLPPRSNNSISGSKSSSPAPEKVEHQTSTDLTNSDAEVQTSDDLKDAGNESPRTDPIVTSGKDEQEVKAPEYQHEEDLCSRGYTLRTLTWDSLVWLRSVDRVGTSSTYKKRILSFLKQSFSYCLSDPQRLINTVKDLQVDYSGPYAEDDSDDGDAPVTFSSTGVSYSPPRVLTRTKLDIDGLLSSLAFLDNFEERDLVLNCIFTALQHSYCLPQRLQIQAAGKRSRSASGSGERALAKGQEVPNTKDGHTLDDATSQGQGESLLPISDPQVAELCLIALMSVASIAFNGRYGQFWGNKAPFDRFATLRNSGLAHSRWSENNDSEQLRRETLRFINTMIKAIDVCDDWSVLRLLYAITDVISHRLLVAKWSAAMPRAGLTRSHKKNVVDLLVRRLDRDTLRGWDSLDKNSSWMGTAIVELLRTVMLKAWDHRPIVPRSGSVGGALELLAGIYRERKDLNLDSNLFHMPFIADVFDEMSMPHEWLTFRADTRQMHLLSFSFLFEPATLVRYFRAINFDMMRKSYESATLVYGDARQYLWAPKIPVYGQKEVLAQMRPHMAKYFVLTIRRDNVLNDAISQIWRRQRMELMRPLRVRLGKDEGEDGVDYGGVQQEFFRVVFAEAFDPNYGMFIVDGATRMAWFQPGSFEPLYRFEALGILMSIAIYNGITLPITFPLAFYRKLLGLKVKKLDHIVDGWPDLTRGLKSLLEWSEGDVGEVIARTYEFSYELCGNTVSVDMQKIGRDDVWPPVKPRSSRKGKEKSKSTSFELPIEPSLTPPIQPSPDLQPSITPMRRKSSVEIKGISTPSSIDSDLLEEAALVTNANREQYVKDYILWLTHKSIQPQYEAFAKGFYTCLDRTALSIFTPEALKAVIEGHPEIDIDELERTVTYEGYERNSDFIGDFWHVVRSFSPEQHRQLLEFVTASDRVPVNGLSSVQFVVQRNGDDDDTRLPSSSTCYGRLLLPMYSSREVMKEKLGRAIENSVGFGTL
ncbi:hypothetical protein LTR67_010604 [Exophiala xenobiotica]